MTDEQAVSKALHVAVAALYFGDNSDYCTALWDVVEALSPETCALLEKDPRGAYEVTGFAAGRDEV